MLMNEKFNSQKKADIDCAVETVNREIDTIIKLRDSLNDSLTDALDLMQ